MWREKIRKHKASPQARKRTRKPRASPQTRKRARREIPTAIKASKKGKRRQTSELAVASRLLLQIDWKGKVLTGDAFYCQRCLCAALLLAGGDYLFLVKGWKPQLFEDLRLLFAPLSPAKRAGEGLLRLPE